MRGDIRELAGLDQMRRGKRGRAIRRDCKRRPSVSRRGPYALYSYKDKKKTVSRRVTDLELARLYRKQIRAFRRFQDITPELVLLGEKISDAIIHEEDNKKN